MIVLIIQLARQASVGGQYNVLFFNGNYYSTLADVSVVTAQSTCQDYSIGLPSGWIVAPDNDDSYTVIYSNPWSTDLVLTSNSAYCSSSCESPGENYGSDYLVTDCYKYSSQICNSQILIVQ
jgi:hypothetical protein